MVSLHEEQPNENKTKYNRAHLLEPPTHITSDSEFR